MTQINSYINERGVIHEVSLITILFVLDFSKTSISLIRANYHDKTLVWKIFHSFSLKSQKQTCIFAPEIISAFKHYLKEVWVSG